LRERDALDVRAEPRLGEEVLDVLLFEPLALERDVLDFVF